MKIGVGHARVRLLPQNVELEVPAGTRLLDAIDQAPRVGLPTACRAANCGLCLVRVREGAQALAPARPDESALCATLGAAAGLRLGCQLELSPELPGPVTIVLELAGAGRASR